MLKELALLMKLHDGTIYPVALTFKQREMICELIEKTEPDGNIKLVGPRIELLDFTYNNEHVPTFSIKEKSVEHDN